jgi:WD40 repeat protein
VAGENAVEFLLPHAVWEERMGYDAFISYSHAADQRLAAALERALQAFARPWNRRRALDIFRDEGNLNLSDHLWRSIQQALTSSRYFIYLASPQAAQSPWVAREIGYWKTHRERDRFIVLWTDGSIAWDAPLADFDPARSTAIPDALRGAFEGEPFYLDMRWTRDENDLTLANDRFKKQVVQLAATLRGLAVEDMAGEEAEQYRRTLRVRNLTIAGLATLSVLALLAAGFALVARGAAVRSEERARTEQGRAEKAASIAEAERKEAEAQRKEAVAARGKALLSEAHANEQADEAARQKTIAEDRAQAAQIALARVSTQEGRRMMDAGRAGEALAHFARALRADSASAAAVWVSSILANGQIWVPGTPLPHDGAVQAVAFSPDGRYVATGAVDGTARIWDTVTGSPVGSVLQHESAITALSYSPDGSRILTATRDSTARLWDARSGAPLEIVFRHRSGITSATFSADGRQVVTTSYDSSATVWEAATGRPVAGPLKHEERVDSAAFSPDGSLVVTAGSDRTARIWNAATGNPVGPPLRHRSDVYTARFSPDGRHILTASADRTAQLWDVKSGTPVGKPLQHAGFVAEAAFSPDGERIVTASYDGTARIWTSTQHPISEPLEHGAIVYKASFSRDGRHVLTASRDGTARVWDAATGLAAGPPLQHRDGLTMAAFSPDGSKIVTASSDMTARVWHAATEGARILRHEEMGPPVEDAVFSADGRRVVTISDTTARVWNASTGEMGAVVRSNSEILAATFTPDGRFVVTRRASPPAAGAAELPVDVWDAETGHFIRRSTREAERVWTAEASADRRVSPDGRIAASIVGNAIRLLNTRTRALLGRPLHHDSDIHSLTFSPDGRYIATGGTNDSARLWDTATGEPVGLVLQNRVDARLQHVINVKVDFSPDGRHVATASDRAYARVWETSSGAPLTPVLPHRHGVYRARFSPDGRRLVTASLDRTARIWTIAAGNGTPASAVLLADLAELAGGFRLTERGTAVPLNQQEADHRRSVLRQARSSDPELLSLIRRLVSAPGAADERGRMPGCPIRRVPAADAARCSRACWASSNAGGTRCRTRPRCSPSWPRSSSSRRPSPLGSTWRSCIPARRRSCTRSAF